MEKCGSCRFSRWKTVRMGSGALRENWTTPAGFVKNAFHKEQSGNIRRIKETVENIEKQTFMETAESSLYEVLGTSVTACYKFELLCINADSQGLNN